jgi:hypothetical protein
MSREEPTPAEPLGPLPARRAARRRRHGRGLARLGRPTEAASYYIAAEPYWLCTQSLPTQSGGLIEIAVTVGTSTTQSAGFTSETR